MSQVINQHYVPQSYLKNFTNSGSQIFVFNKFEQRSFPSNVKNVASERFFYDLPQDVTQPENVQIIERLFSELEKRQGKFMHHIHRKIDGFFSLRHIGKAYSTNVLTIEQKRDLACIAAIQFLRTREFRNFLIEIRHKTETLGNKVLEKEIFDRIREFELELDENLAQSHVEFLRQAGYDADRVPDEGLSGADDEVVWQQVCAEGRFFITLDLNFSDVRRFPPGTHPGILLLRSRNRSRQAVLDVLSRVVSEQPLENFRNCLVVADETQTRIRRPPISDTEG